MSYRFLQFQSCHVGLRVLECCKFICDCRRDFLVARLVIIDCSLASVYALFIVSHSKSRVNRLFCFVIVEKSLLLSGLKN